MRKLSSVSSKFWVFRHRNITKDVNLEDWKKFSSSENIKEPKIEWKKIQNILIPSIGSKKMSSTSRIAPKNSKVFIHRELYSRGALCFSYKLKKRF